MPPAPHTSYTRAEDADLHSHRESHHSMLNKSRPRLSSSPSPAATLLHHLRSSPTRHAQSAPLRRAQSIPEYETAILPAAPIPSPTRPHARTYASADKTSVTLQSSAYANRNHASGRNNLPASPD